MLLVKWRGHIDATWESRAHILRECNNPELLREIEEATQRYQEETRVDADDDEVDEPSASYWDAPTSRRERRQPVRYTPAALGAGSGDAVVPNSDTIAVVDAATSS